MFLCVSLWSVTIHVCLSFGGFLSVNTTRYYSTNWFITDRKIWLEANYRTKFFGLAVKNCRFMSTLDPVLCTVNKVNSSKTSYLKYACLQYNNQCSVTPLRLNKRQACHLSDHLVTNKETFCNGYRGMSNLHF